MTKRDPHSGEEKPRHLVAQAERQLAAFGEMLDATIEDIKAGNLPPPKDWAAQVTAMRKALEAVFSERARLDKLSQGDGPRDGELDLDAARTEIRRRMDRLRAVADPRGVPGGAE